MYYTKVIYKLSIQTGPNKMDYTNWTIQNNKNKMKYTNCTRLYIQDEPIWSIQNELYKLKCTKLIKTKYKINNENVFRNLNK